jgi:transposase
MQPKIKHSDRYQTKFIIGSIDDLVEPDHEVRELWAFLDELDFSPILAAIVTTKGQPGAPAFCPKVLVAIWLYGLAYGIYSSRKLSTLCAEWLPLRWICGDVVPSYHKLSDFRIDAGEVLDKWLVDGLAVLVSEGFLFFEGMEVAHDSTRVRASAGNGSYRRRATLEEALAEAELRVEALKKPEALADCTKRQAAARKRAARERLDRTTRALAKIKELEAKPRKADRSAPRVSTTDPDAPKVRMANGGIGAGYAIQITADTKTRVITAVGIGVTGSDYSELVPAVERHREMTGSLPKAIFADKGFEELSDIGELEEIGVEVYVPDSMPDTDSKKRLKPEMAAWRLRMKTPAAIAHYCRVRPSTIEWVNARIKTRGLSVISVRGRAKAAIIAKWHALRHNIDQTFYLRKMQKLAETENFKYSG